MGLIMLKSNGLFFVSIFLFPFLTSTSIFSMGMSRASSPLLFDVQRYGCPGRHQAPVDTLPIGEEIFKQTSTIKDWVFLKISLPIVWLTASYGASIF